MKDCHRKLQVIDKTRSVYTGITIFAGKKVRLAALENVAGKVIGKLSADDIRYSIFYRIREMS